MENHNTQYPLLTLAFGIMSSILAWFTDFIHIVSLHEDVIHAADSVLSLLTKTGSLLLICISVMIYIHKGALWLKKNIRGNKR